MDTIEDSFAIHTMSSIYEKVASSEPEAGRPDDRLLSTIASDNDEPEIPELPPMASSSTTDDDDGGGGDDDEESDNNDDCWSWHAVLHQTLLPDRNISIRGLPLVEGLFTVKLLKFLLLTFGSIALVHVAVKSVGDRNRSLRFWQIWRYEGTPIVQDTIVFFLVGRMWKQRGVDHLAWILPMVVCNIYFESQNYIFFLQHSVTLFEMHCKWPWELWLFVLILIPTITALVLAHIRRAWEKGILLVKVSELILSVGFFLVPVMTSSYFHFHHWFAGWLLGMHCNLDVWWSRALMAYCWGMYINGIAVYGRGPVLTCEYAYFMSVDNHCPFMNCYIDQLEEQAIATNTTAVVDKMEPAVDWRNCSASGYHP